MELSKSEVMNSVDSGSVLVIEPCELMSLSQEHYDNDPLFVPSAEVPSAEGQGGPTRKVELLLQQDTSRYNLPSSTSKKIHSTPTSQQIRNMWNWRRIFTKLGTKDQCVKFAEERRLVSIQRDCSYHHRPMTLTKKGGPFGVFKCYKARCRTRPTSRASGTWFEVIHLPLASIFQIMYCFSQGFSYHQVTKQTDRDDGKVISQPTVAAWYISCRETLLLYELAHQECDTKIGGPNKTVQINKAVISKRKWNKGTHLEGYWVIGMMEEGKSDIRLELCPGDNQASEYLTLIVKKHIQDGTTIQTEEWNGYSKISEEGYVHNVVPDGKLNQWCEIKRKYRYKNPQIDFADWLVVEHCWRKKCKNNILDEFEELLKAIAHVYKVK